MSRANDRRERGMTLPEMLTAMALLGLFTTFVVALIGPIASAPRQMQVKIDAVQGTVDAGYRIQRDLRNGDVDGVFACTAGPVTTCARPGSALSPSMRLAIATPLDASGQLQVAASTSAAAWTGLRVYCLSAPSSAGALTVSFQPVSGIESGAAGIRQLSLATVASAVSAGCADSSRTTIAVSVESLSTAADAPSRIVRVRLVTRGTSGGKTNENSYESASYTRN